MKTLLLLRHAKSSWKDPTLRDFDRPLNKRGKKACKIMARYFTDAGIRPDFVLCSAATRALATLQGVRDAFDPEVTVAVEDGLYHASAGTMLGRLQDVPDDVGTVMMIGHNPAMEDFAEALADGTMAALEGDMRAKFPTAALAALMTPIERWADAAPGGFRLVSFVCPRDVEAH